MKLKSLVVLATVLIGVAIIFLGLSDIAVDVTISKHPSGDSVVSMGSGFLLFSGRPASSASPDYTRYNYSFETLEYRNSEGQTLKRYKPNGSPNDYAYVEWTDRLVLISSGMNGECPDFRVLKRNTGAELEHDSNEILRLPGEVLRRMDPCGWGRDDNQKWIEQQGFQSGL